MCYLPIKHSGTNCAALRFMTKDGIFQETKANIKFHHIRKSGLKRDETVGQCYDN